MPKVKRADTSRAQDKPQRGRARRQNTTKVAGTAPQRQVSNWLAAQWRTASYRASYAFRLFLIGVLVIGALIIGGAAGLGRLDDMGAGLLAMADARLTQAGFIVRTVDVAGAEQVSAAEIAEIMGAAGGVSMLSIDPEAARQRIESLSWVESASVARLWPNRISVVIEERKPYALWQVGGYHHVIDRHGVVIAQADPRQYADLPRVVGAGADVAVAEIIDLLDHRPELKPFITHAVRVGERRWNLRLVSGADLMLPQDDPASALALVMGLQNDRGVLGLDAQAFDLRTPGELIVRAWPDRAQAAQHFGREA
ncbi:cell division protein FtsQ/DivIB [Woodsholea maritima]|uniref:cell division protein FtsQ/DivIB n=1 Tax=Woodsholea maritima TaxID=240237 RepID=UPI00035EF6F6|nr:FtsQ-type POTRA domain-containing protein [Woodsholea maritima]